MKHDLKIREELKLGIEDAFSSIPYPECYDFNQAVSDYDYIENKSKNKIPWSDVCESDLKKYGEIIHFFDKAGAIYYLPAYMVNLLFYESLWELACFDSFISFLQEVDVELFTVKQRCILSKFAAYASSVVDDDIDAVELSMLEERFRKNS